MTLIVAVKCRDGIVVGADGAATLGVPGQPPTARQPVRKLQIVKGKLIIGTSGPVGLGQRLADEITTIWNENKLSNKSPEAAMTYIRQEFVSKHIGVELQVAGMAKNAIGAAALSSALSHTVLAIPISRQLCLFQFDQQGAPEMATADLPFVAVGSGQAIADPFMAFLRRVLWQHTGKGQDSLPPLGDGITATLWTLQHAILTSPGGIADPVQMMIIRKEGKDFGARELDETELAEHSLAIESLEDTIGSEWLRLREPPAAGDVSPVPSPDAE